MKKLTCQQAHWLEYLSQFNLWICFCPGRLGTKPDALTQHLDVHPGSGADTTPTNVHPLFTPQQLDAPTFRAGELDQLQILMDISKLLPEDTFAQSVKVWRTNTHQQVGNCGMNDCGSKDVCTYLDHSTSN